MSFAIGLVISLLILYTTIYFLHFSNKKSLLILLLLTTGSFILSSLMGMLYSPFIGIGIFFLLIICFALLVGKKLDLLYKENSKRRGNKENPVYDGSQLENISTIDDHLLFKINDSNINLQTFEKSKVHEKMENKPHQKETIPLLEVAATTNIDEEQQSGLNGRIEIKDEVILDSVDGSKKAILRYDSQGNEKVDEELSDLWMQKRMSALFVEKAKENSLKKDMHENLEGENMLRYDDLSESYFNHKRSEDDGTEE